MELDPFLSNNFLFHVDYLILINWGLLTPVTPSVGSTFHILHKYSLSTSIGFLVSVC